MKYLYFALILFYTIPAFSQNIKGTVKTTKGEPVSSATVTVLNSTKAIASDLDGRFTLSLPNGTYQLSFSAVGFATQFRNIDVKSGADIELDVQLQVSGRQLNEVVVNAEKREQDVQKVPAAITVLDAKQIRDYRLWDITNLTAISPSLFTVEHGNSTSSNFFNIRGVMGFSNEQAVATYVDGVYQFDYFSAPPLFNDWRIR